MSLRLVTPGDVPDPASLVDVYLVRYTNAQTARRNAVLRRFLSDLDCHDLDTLSDDHVAAWCTRSRANNSVRQNVPELRTFFRWAVLHGHLHPVRT